MDGIINVLKPPGMTSHDVVAYLRRLFQIKKIGHGGTLDPAAAGVLPLFIGRATKAIEFFSETDKEYVAEMVLGITTDTGDSEGNILSTRQVNVDIDRINHVFTKFVGKIEQIPPMYSAVHYHGKKLYELARHGMTVERKPRTVEIKSLELIYFKDNIVTFRTTCSKGTYIRTLCEDIGQHLECGAFLSCLVRTRVGLFYIDKSYTIEEIQQNVSNNAMDKMIIPIDECMAHLPAIELPAMEKNNFSRGRVLYYDFDHELNGFVRVYSGGIFIGIAKVEIQNQKSCIRLVKTFF